MLALTTRSGRRRSGGSRRWSIASLAVAVLVVVPVAMLAGSVLRPSTEVWSQQWRTRLPGELKNTALLLVGVGVTSVVMESGEVRESTLHHHVFMGAV